jgi:hypothetical protein
LFFLQYKICPVFTYDLSLQQNLVNVMALEPIVHKREKWQVQLKTVDSRDDDDNNNNKDVEDDDDNDDDGGWGYRVFNMKCAIM